MRPTGCSPAEAARRPARRAASPEELEQLIVAPHGQRPSAVPAGLRPRRPWTGWSWPSAARRRAAGAVAPARRAARQRLSAHADHRGAQRRLGWRPSPGSVYPSLSQLEDEGLIQIRRGRRCRAGSRSPTRLAESTWRAAPRSPSPGKPADEEGENSHRRAWPHWSSQIDAKAAWQVATVGDEAQRARAIQILGRAPCPLYTGSSPRTPPGPTTPRTPTFPANLTHSRANVDRR